MVSYDARMEPRDDGESKPEILYFKASAADLHGLGQIKSPCTTTQQNTRMTARVHAAMRDEVYSVD